MIAYLTLNIFGPVVLAQCAQFISYLAIVLNSINLFCPTCMKGDLQEKKNSNDTEARAGDLDAVFSRSSCLLVSQHFWPSLNGHACPINAFCLLDSQHVWPSCFSPMCPISSVWNDSLLDSQHVWPSCFSPMCPISSVWNDSLLDFICFICGVKSGQCWIKRLLRPTIPITDSCLA